MSFVFFKISGIKSINCKIRIENHLMDFEGIKKVDVNWKKALAIVEYDENIIGLDKIKQEIESLDYKVINIEGEKDNSKGNFLKPMINSIVYLLIIVFLFIFLQKTGLLNYLAPAQTADSKMGYGLLFLMGIFTSVHCLAMCGGINLSQSLGGKNAVIKYNLARILSYTLIGFVLGSLGFFLGTAGKSFEGNSVIIPFSVQSVLKLLAGLFMILMGFSLLGLFPFFEENYTSSSFWSCKKNIFRS